MKKLTFLMLAIMTCVMASAQGNITYELNGGVTNPDGWQDKQDMYEGLNADWNTFNGATSTWTSLAELVTANGTAEAAVPKGIPTEAGALDLPFIQDATVAAKWQWLVDYMDAACTAQGKTLPSTSGAFLRYNFSAFFLSSVRPGWPASADYTAIGGVDAFGSTWKHAFAGPASYTADGVAAIADPYKEGFTFGGWFKEADFSGAKVTEVAAGTTGDITLYAKWDAYVSTCAEVWALGTDGAAAKTMGVVTYVDGKNMYIQDATAGMYVYCTEDADAAPGDKVVVSGVTSEFKGQFQIKNAVIDAKEAAELPAVQNVTMAQIVADTLAYMYEYVGLTGVKIVAYDSYKNPTLSDGTNEFLAHKVVLDDSQLPIGTLVNVTLTLANFDGALQFKGYDYNVLAAPVPRPETQEYATMLEKYNLKNEWIVSDKMGNWAANRVGGANFVRGMAVKDGKMYFPDRENKRLLVVDGATGEKLDPIPLVGDYFKYEINAGTDSAALADAGILPYNDIKVDGAGNVLLCNAVGQPFQVWMVDLTTGEGTKVLECDVKEANPFDAATRFDAFGVYGDVKGDAIIMAVNAEAAANFGCYRWTITGGVADPTPEYIEPDLSADPLTGGAAEPLTNWGSAPQIFPIADGYFYVDGNTTFPTLLDADGIFVDGFQNNNGLLEKHIIVGTDTTKLKLNVGHNGLCEFQVGDEYFLLMAAGNTVATPPSTFAVYKYADEMRIFEEMEMLWVFPREGMGSISNAYRTAVPSVEVNGNEATLYVYAGENGYGAYTMTVGGSGIESATDARLFIDRAGKLSETVSEVEVYNIAGQHVFSAKNTNAIKLGASGIYVVKATMMDGEVVTLKHMN